MSIVSSESELSPQAGGLVRVRHRYTFHNGEVYRILFKVEAAGFDADADRAARVAEVETQVRNGEIEGLVMGAVDRAEAGESPDIMAILPEHPSDQEDDFTRQRRFRRQLLRWAIRHRDLKVVRRLFYAVWFWLKFESGYTGQQIADYLTVPLAVVTAIDSRMQAIHDNLAFVDADAEFEVD
jgi:hypothetical protein